MDSSRSGLLSTLLMTLPLIVVPAIALLRPPGSLTGVSTAALNASESEEDDFLINELDALSRNFGSPEEPGDKSDRKDSSDEIDQLFGDDFPDSSESDSRPDREPSPGQAKSRPISQDPFMPSISEVNGRPDPESTSVDAEDDPAGSAEMIVEQLNAQGALRTMWFEAGAKSPVGFAAFFRGQTELVRMRFEAVGQTRDECARSVLRQVTRWQSAQNARQN